MSLPGTNFPWIVIWLAIAATIFTFYFGFVQFHYFEHAVQVVKPLPVPLPVLALQAD
jgi:AGCS family alanine or glycine:cation symporter